MKQQATFTLIMEPAIGTAFLLGRAISILEGLVESPTDARDIQLARDLLADCRKWVNQE